ncbi:unnamed protein product, partial [Allacma fusca]
ISTYTHNQSAVLSSISRTLGSVGFMESLEVVNLTKDMSPCGISVTCSNCSGLLFPMEQVGPDSSNENRDFESHPVFELTQGEKIVAISSVLERIYRFSQLRDLYGTEEPMEDTPMCPKCADILNQMDMLHQEFDDLRGLEILPFYEDKSS